MTLLRFWRKSKDDEPDEDLDKTEEDQSNIDKTSKGIGTIYSVIDL